MITLFYLDIYSFRNIDTINIKPFLSNHLQIKVLSRTLVLDELTQSELAYSFEWFRCISIVFELLIVFPFQL